MPLKAHYEADEGQSTGNALSLLNVIGQSHTLTQGWASFALKTLIVSNCAATVFGLAGMMLGHEYVGHVLSFLLGAGFGFVGGLRHRWVVDTAEAAKVFSTYPDIMKHHLLLVDHRLLDRVPFDKWRENMNRSVMKQGFAVAALYSAADTLQRLRQEEEEILIQKFMEKLQAEQHPTEDE